MKFRVIAIDVLREHIRSRAVYAHILLAVAVILVLSIIYLENLDNCDYPLYFETRFSQPAHVQLERLQNADSVAVPLAEAAFPESAPIRHWTRPDRERLVQLAVASTTDVWLAEMPDVEIGHIVVASRNGILTEPPELLGIASCSLALLNRNIALDLPQFHHLSAATFTCDNTMMLGKSSFLASNVEAVTRSFVRLLDTPLPDREGAGRDIFNQCVLTSCQEVDSIKDRLRRSIFSEIAPYLVTGPVERQRAAANMNQEALQAWIDDGFSPGSLIVIVAGPYCADEISGELTRWLEPLLTRPPVAPRQHQLVITPRNGQVQDKTVRHKGVAASECAMIIPAAGRQLHPRFVELANALAAYCNRILRNEGLVYAPTDYLVLEWDGGLLLLSSYETELHHGSRLLQQTHAWFSQFPDQFRRETIDWALGATRMLARLARSNPQSASGMILTQLISGNQPLAPVDMERYWSACDEQELRRIFETGQPQSYLFQSALVSRRTM